MLVTITLLTLWLTMLIAPDTPVGRYLHRILVVAPAERLGRITRGQILLAIALFAVAGIAMWLTEGDGLRLLSMAAPDISMWITTFEVTTYIDVAAAALIAASTVRFSAMGSRLRAVLPGKTRRQSRRASRARRVRRPVRPSADNDEDAVVIGVAA